MRRIQTTAALLAAVAMFGIGTFAQNSRADDQKASNNSTAQQNQQQSAAESRENGAAANNSKQSQQTPEGFVLVDEQLITLTANEPQNHFIRAQEYLSQNDPRAAAAEVRIGAAYLDMQASRKGEADQKDLRSVSAHLRKIADQLAKGEMNESRQANGQEKNGQEKNGQEKNGQANAASGQITGQSSEQQRLNHAFAHAERALAQHFQEEARNEIGQKRAVRAGEDLDAAASALRASIVWTNQQCSSECMQAINATRQLSDELLTPAGENQQRQQSASAKQGENAERQGTQGKESANEEAQPAGARLSGEQEGATATENNRIPADAEKVVDELGKAIESTGSRNSAQHPGEGAQAEPNNNQSQNEQQRPNGNSNK